MGEVNSNRNVQTFTSQSDRGQLREVVAYKRFQIKLFDLETSDRGRGARLR